MLGSLLRRSWVYWPAYLVLIIFFLGWEFATRAGFVSRALLPPPSVAVMTIPQIWITISPHIVISLTNIGVSFALAGTVGIGLGMILGSVKFLREVSDPFIMALFSIPKAIFLPMFMLWFGLGFNLKMIYAAYAGAFPALINTIVALKDMDTNQILLAKSMGASQTQIYFKVIWPAVTPMLLVGLRLSLIITTTAVILAELFIPRGGMGSIITIFAEKVQYNEVYASIIAMAMISVTLVLPLLAFEKMTSRWRHIAHG